MHRPGLASTTTSCAHRPHLVVSESSGSGDAGTRRTETHMAERVVVVTFLPLESAPHELRKPLGSAVSKAGER